jgi:hypothetical protein
MNDGIIKMSPQFASMPRALLGAASTVPTPLPYWPYDANNITSGLVGWWKCDEINGTTAVDSSGNGMNGTLSGGARFSENPGIIGNSLGPNKTIVVPNNALQNFAGNFTLSGWSKATFLGWGFVKNSNNTLGQYLFQMRPNAPYNGLYFRSNTNFDVGLSVNMTALLTDGNWHHLCVTRTGTAIAIYIDAVRRGFGAPTLGNFSTNTLNLTMASGGSMDDMRMYNRALSPAEVASLYAYRGRNLYESP